MDDVLCVRNVARYAVRIGKDLVEPGEVWTGERGFVMIALRRYPGRLEAVERGSGGAEERESGGGSEDNRLLSAEEEPSPPAPLPKSGEGSLTPRSAMKRRRKGKVMDE
jgi:hypothetical protein